MATMTISYDGRSRVARNVVELIRSLDVFTITEQPATSVETFASSSEMFQSLGI